LVTTEMTQLILEKIPDISAEWLMRGKEEMIIKEPKLPRDYMAKVDKLMEIKEEMLKYTKSKKNKSLGLPI